MPKGRFVFDWTCPGCGQQLHFSWPPEDVAWAGQASWLVCEGGYGGCNRMSRHTWNGERWEFTGDIKPWTGNKSLPAAKPARAGHQVKQSRSKRLRKSKE